MELITKLESAGYAVFEIGGRAVAKRGPSAKIGVSDGNTLLLRLAKAETNAQAVAALRARSATVEAEITQAVAPVVAAAISDSRQRVVADLAKIEATIDYQNGDPYRVNQWCMLWAWLMLLDGETRTSTGESWFELWRGYTAVVLVLRHERRKQAEVQRELVAG